MPSSLLINRKQKTWIDRNIFNRLRSSQLKAKRRNLVTKYLYSAIVIEFEVLRKKRRNLHIYEGQALLLDEISALSSTIHHLALTKRFKRSSEEGYGSPDYTSLFLITQSLVNYFLIYEHIFMLSKSQEDCIIRFQLWSAFESIELPLVNGRSPESKSSRQVHLLGKKNSNTIFELCQRDFDFKRFDKAKIKDILTKQFKRMRNWRDLLTRSKLNYDIFYSSMKLFQEYSNPNTTTLLQNNSSPLNFISKDLMQLDRVHLCLSIVKIINSQFTQRNSIMFSDELIVPKVFYEFSNESYDKAFDRWIKAVIDSDSKYII